MDMDFDEIFGTTPETDADQESVQEQELADPADDYEDEGVNEQDTDAEPAADQGKALTPEQRHANAARRRAAEIERVRQEEREKARAEMDAFVKDLGQKNSYDGNKPIQTKAEWDEYKRAQKDKAIERTLAKTGLNKEQLDDIIDARIAERAPGRQPAAQEEPASHAEVNRQYAEIQSLDPYAPSLAELAGDKAYMDEVAKSGSMVEAYKEVYGRQARSRAGQFEAQTRAQGKAHLQRTSSRGGDAIIVTREMREAYRVFDPDITDDDIRKEEARYRKATQR